MPMSRSSLRAAGAVAAVALAACAALAQGFNSARVVKTQGFLSFDKVHPGSTFRLGVVAEVEKGWHVNAHKPSFEYLIATTLNVDRGAGAEGFTFEEPIYPAPRELAFAFTGGKTLRVYEGQVMIGVQATASRDMAPGIRTVRATLTTQACNDTSCLAPAQIPIEIAVPIPAPGEPVSPTHTEIFAAIAFDGGALPSQVDAVPAPGGDDQSLARLVERWGWAPALAFIFLGGLALNLTPCVYPLIPITLAYFGGQAAGRPARTFGLASIYVLGMCLTYSALGVVAATTGSILGAALQSPIALGFVALVMVALGLSMMGLYEIQVPTALRRRVTSHAGFGGALFMGLTVGLVAAPCVGPFVVSLLAYVGQIGSPLLGFWLFFVLALGLGLPYLLLGGFSGTATGLPRAGAWMEWVKKSFGCIMFAMAWYFLNPLLPGAIAGFTIPATLLASALYLGFIEGSPIKSAGFRAARLATGAVCVAIAAALLLGAGSSAGVAWEPFTQEALARARETGRPVIIDFTADWCLPCKELDRFTFADPEVAEASRQFVTLKADITKQLSDDVRALQQEYRILGAPTIVFLDPSGRERQDLRLTGFERAGDFLQRMRRAL